VSVVVGDTFPQPFLTVINYLIRLIRCQLECVSRGGPEVSKCKVSVTVNAVVVSLVVVKPQPMPVPLPVSSYTAKTTFLPPYIF